MKTFRYSPPVLAMLILFQLITGCAAVQNKQAVRRPAALFPYGGADVLVYQVWRYHKEHLRWPENINGLEGAALPGVPFRADNYCFAVFNTVDENRLNIDFAFRARDEKQACGSPVKVTVTTVAEHPDELTITLHPADVVEASRTWRVAAPAPRRPPAKKETKRQRFERLYR